MPSKKEEHIFKTTDFTELFASLSAEQRKQPKEVIRVFFDNYHFDDIRQICKEWLFAAFSARPSLFDNARERSNLLFFFEGLLNTLAAVQTLYGEPISKPDSGGKVNTVKKVSAKKPRKI